MATSELQNWLLGRDGFQKRLRDLEILGVASQFPDMSRDGPKEDEIDLAYLLECASLLAQSDDGRSQEAALRIAQFCLESADSPSSYLDAAGIVLDMLANRPAIDLAIERHLLRPDLADRLPLQLLAEWTRRSFTNSITLGDHGSLSVNRFQKEFWETASSNSWVSVTAPTSAGKSYILEYWILEFLRSHQKAYIVYLVPTRALIHQVQCDIGLLLKNENIEGVSVNNVPLSSYIEESTSNILVFTQERFHILLADKAFHQGIDLLIVDEAQKIGDGYRGVLLQQAIEATADRNPGCRVIFASPNVLNPESLLEDAPRISSRASVSRDDVMVSQNLLWVSQAPRKTKHWYVEYITQKEPVRIGSIELPMKPTPHSKRLPFVSYTLGRHSTGNLIYVNGAAEAEKVSMQLFDLMEDPADSLQVEELFALGELSEHVVHPKYSLSKVIMRGIAFHYGSMPLLLRTEIERLFTEGHIQFLVCTSTLVEGVNMPCKNIFMRGPTKGRGRPMNPTDFWNLAGRAGRWGKEFQGNAICIDARKEGVWKAGVPSSRTRFRIQRTTDEVLGESERLVEFISNGTPRKSAKEDPNLEYVFSYLSGSILRNGTLKNTPWANRFTAEMVEQLDSEINSALAEVEVSDSTILHNPGISPLAMDALFKQFRQIYTDGDGEAESLLPADPGSDDAWDRYTYVLSLVNEYLGNVFGTERRIRMIAVIVIQWMQGLSLARIIRRRERAFPNEPLPKLIRDAMNDVEEFARFQSPKFLSCYVAVLRDFLQSVGRDDLLAELFEVNVLLEFGVAQTTQLSLMGLGLSRSSAIALSELIADDSLREQECLDWLQRNDWMVEELPVLIKREIQSVFESQRSDFDRR